MATSSKLCCLLATNIKCRECGEVWCETCWFGTNPYVIASPATSHTTGTTADGGWGKCPIINKKMRWDPKISEDGICYIIARDYE